MESHICVLIPALNAEGAIGEIIKGCKKYIRDVIVVDDGSFDNTSFVSQNEGAFVIKHNRNTGKGMALRTGFAYALSKGYDGVITIDADGQHNPSDIPLFLKRYYEESPDIIIGNRMWQKWEIPKYRYYTNLVGIYFISRASGQIINDSQSGFRLYRKEVIEGISLKTTGFEAETEILIKAGRMGYRIVSIPVGVNYKNINSHYRRLKDTLRIGLIVLKSMFRQER
jgi:glycosyltransferase involved in cell wall biosynthesis